MSGAKTVFRSHKKNGSIEILTGFTCMLNDTIQVVKTGGSFCIYIKVAFILDFPYII